MMDDDYMKPILAQVARTIAEFERTNLAHIARLLASQEAAYRVIADLSAVDLSAIDRVSQQAAREVARIQKEIGPALLNVQRALVNTDVIDQIYRTWDASQQRAAAILAEKGWWVTPDLPLGLLNKVVDLRESKKSGEINKAMCDYYTGRRIRKLIKGWSTQSLISPREHIFEQALWAHNKKRWYLTIPVLLTQIDGVLQDFSGHTSLPKGSSVKKIAAELHLPSSSPSTIISDTWYVQLNELFGSGYYQTEKRQPGLRRNAILHGLELRYGSRVRSTQLFLQLQTIQWLISRKLAKSAA